ncbi:MULTISPECIES: hypothetical protein [Halomonas]|uniref:hypothetical protein n=1 Tax=Halomonas TaxID=2745 RepID=UPI001C94FD14|nr:MULTISPECIES: hypothetical protein [Halomonas]MBY6207791.1 hypothetical protein [Halomonas sp. DP3Y7-2]MBY6228600.1 hypothetical protein [Halomonas sp. DP3Y7-1]MCA0916666.1 hypothetical protein [Halomonas denitrificans]
MKDVTLPAALLALGVALASSTVQASDSVMTERFREENRQLDLTGFFKPESDARSQTFLFGTPHAHDFEVEEEGVYRFESRVSAGYEDTYQIEAVLQDDAGNVIARGQGYGQEGGLQLESRLTPGKYELQVKGTRFGRRGRAGDGYSIAVVGLDSQGNRIEVDDGVGLQFVGADRDGNQSAFVTSRDAVVTLGGESAAATSASATASGASAASSSATASSAAASSAGATSAAAGGAAVAGTAAVAGASESVSGSEARSNNPDERQVQSVKTDVKIRARGEVLSFNVAEPSQVRITTSTFPPGDEDTYRLTMEVADGSGRIVAEGAGEGFNGNVDLSTQLDPGTYHIRVTGQKFGSSMDGPNNYELKVVLDN